MLSGDDDGDFCGRRTGYDDDDCCISVADDGGDYCCVPTADDDNDDDNFCGQAADDDDDDDYHGQVTDEKSDECHSSHVIDMNGTTHSPLSWWQKTSPSPLPKITLHPISAELRSFTPHSLHLYLGISYWFGF